MLILSNFTHVQVSMLYSYLQFNLIEIIKHYAT